MVGKQRGQRGRRGWWLLLLLGAAIAVCGYFVAAGYYGGAETKSLANVAFWGMLAGDLSSFNR